MAVGETTVLLVGEGPHELGRPRGEVGPSDDLPPLATLVSRLLGRQDRPRFLCKPGKDIRNIHRGKMGSRYGKKAYSAIRYAQRKGLHAVVLLMDRDGPANVSRLSDMREGRSQIATSFPCALGVAVEAFDAWMIADAEAIEAAGGDRSETTATPDSVRAPKDLADGIFGTRRGSGLGPKYSIIAEHVDLSLLEKACPEGFGPFADEIRERIAPAVA